ncbi:MAG: ABC transporter substrate-binding protein [Blastopirellula sp.]|nr:MAG: ABC transporter substrate-binding protein [Blastopirellula sp.]
MQIRILTLCCLGAMLFTLGCGSPPAPTNTLIYGRGGDADGLDPTHTDIGESVKVIVNIFDKLVDYDEETLDLVPSLALSWETSDDGLVWTFDLREGVKFHDGTPFNAEAVAFTINRIIQPDHPHAYDNVIPFYPNYEGIESVTPIDEHTVQFKLKHPSATFISNMAMFPASIVSPTAVKIHKEHFARNPVGTGPFKFEHWKTDQQLVLAANDNHWRGRPTVDRVIFIPVKESAVRVKQLERGEIHIADNLPPSEVDELAKLPTIKIQETEGMNVGYMTMNMDKPPLDNLLVREAIWHAIDRDRLIDVAYSGHATKAVSMVPPTMWAHHSGLADREFDPEKSKQLLAEAERNAGVKLPIKLQLFVMAQPRPYMQRPRQTVVFIKDSLERVGFDIEIVTNDIRQHFFRMTQGEHQLGLAGWSADIPDPDNFLYTLLDLDNINDDGGNNLSRYRNEEMHDWLIAAKSELDVEKRKQLYLKAQESIFRDAPVLPLVHTKVRIAQRKELSGYKLHPSSMVRLRHSKITP